MLPQVLAKWRVSQTQRKTRLKQVDRFLEASLVRIIHEIKLLSPPVINKTGGATYNKYLLQQGKIDQVFILGSVLETTGHRQTSSDWNLQRI